MKDIPKINYMMDSEFTTIKILKKILKLTLVNGTITYLTEKVNVFIKMVIYMKECGQMVYIVG